MSDNGSSIKQISALLGSSVTPRWSPNGQQIAFLQDTDPSAKSVRNTFIMNADGTNVRQLTNQKVGFNRLAFSPDGKKLLVNRQIDIGEKNAGLMLWILKLRISRRFLTSECLTLIGHLWKGNSIFENRMVDGGS